MGVLDGQRLLLIALRSGNIIDQEGLGRGRELLDLRLLQVLLAMVRFTLHNRRDMTELLLFIQTCVFDDDEGALLGAARAGQIELTRLVMLVRV